MRWPPQPVSLIGSSGTVHWVTVTEVFGGRPRAPTVTTSPSLRPWFGDTETRGWTTFKACAWAAPTATVDIANEADMAVRKAANLTIRISFSPRSDPVGSLAKHKDLAARQATMRVLM
jgi:hypothetical protein